MVKETDPSKGVTNEGQETPETVEELLREFSEVETSANGIRDSIEDNSDKIKANEGELSDEMFKSLCETDEAIQIKGVVRQTIKAIEEGQLPLEGSSAQVIDELVNKVKDEVTDASASYIYYLLDQGIKNQLNTSERLISALKNISNLRYINSNLFKTIVISFKEKAETFGLNENQRQEFERLKKGSEVEEEDFLREEDREKLRKKFSDIANRVMGSQERGRETKGLLDPSNINISLSDIKEKYADELSGLEDFSPSEKEQHINHLLEKEKEHILGDLQNKFLNLTGTPDSDLKTLEELNKARVKSLSDFKSTVLRYQAQGILDQSTAESLIDHGDEVFKLLDEEFKSLNYSKNTLEAEIRHLVGDIFTDEQWKLVRGLDDIDIFAKLIEVKFTKTDGTINWDEFYILVKDIFEKLFEIVELNPQQEFQRSFNPMYEGHVYDLLIQAISRLGRQTHNLPDEHLLKQTVKLWDFTDTGDTFKEGQTPEGGTSRLTYIKKDIEVPLAEALERTLVHRMVKLRSITEFLHNVNYMVEFGGNFEQLAGYAEHLSIADIDLLFQEDPYLAQAYELYMTSLMQEMGENMRVVPTTFGKSDFLTGLDSTEKRTLYQLLAMTNCSSEKKSKMVRRTWMSSAISKGVTGEFWAVLSASKMPIDKKVVYKRDKKGNILIENGEPVVERYETEGAFTGINKKGYEKTSGHLDLALSKIRYGLPNFLKELIYTPAPRDLNDIQFEIFSHADVYKIAKESEDAFWRGRSDWLADFQDKSVIMADYFKRHGIDIFIRGGWRFFQYRSLLVFSEQRDPRTNELIIDFDKTMQNLKRVGLYAVKTFIDDFFIKEADYRHDISNIDLDNLQDSVFKHYLPDYDPNKKLTKNQKKKLKEGLYADYIFDRLLKLYPSVFIGIESREHTPQNEEKVRDRIVSVLNNKFSDYPPEMIKSHLMPIFISALSMAEKRVWNIKKEQGNFDYIFSQDDLESVRDEVIRIFSEYKTNEGVQELQGVEYKLSDISDDYYFEVLKELLGDYREFLESDRWSRNKHKEKYKETLSQRYSHLMVQNMGMLENLIGGFDFDFHEFFLQQGGDRLAARWLGESNIVMTKMNDAFKNIMNRSIPELIKRSYNSIEEFEKAVNETVAKDVYEFTQAYAENVGKEWAADELANYWSIFLGRMLGLDDKYRTPFIGGPLKNFSRRLFGTQGSLLTDAYKEAHDRKTTALDGEMLWVLARTIGNKCNIHLDEKRIKGYEPVKIFGKKIPGLMKPIFDENKIHMRQVEKALKVTPGWRFVEKYIPLIGGVIVLIMLAMMYAAQKEDETQ